MGERSVHVLVDHTVVLIEDGVTFGEEETHKLREEMRGRDGRRGEGGERRGGERRGREGWEGRGREGWEGRGEEGRGGEGR